MQPACSRIYAFEPDPCMRSVLQAIVSDHANIEVVDMAVGRILGSVSFELEPAGEVSHLSRDGEVSRNAIQVSCTTIDAFVADRGIDQLSAIKTDIEGFDVDAIAGATHVMTHLHPMPVGSPTDARAVQARARRALPGACLHPRHRPRRGH